MEHVGLHTKTARCETLRKLGNLEPGILLNSPADWGLQPGIAMVAFHTAPRIAAPLKIPVSVLDHEFPDR
jgi:hypothetical protein